MRARLAGWAFAAYAAALFVVAVLPLSGPVVGGGDKLHHLVGFLVFALLLGWARPRLGWLAAWGIATLYGGSIELVQLFLPWRSAEWLDLGADALGAALGLAGVELLRRRGRATAPEGRFRP